MKANIKKPTEIEIKQMNIYLKIRDEFTCSLFDKEGNEVLNYEGYVPDIVPGDYGDYLDLEIDIDTGKILNWNLTTDKLQTFINEQTETEDD